MLREPPQPTGPILPMPDPSGKPSKKTVCRKGYFDLSQTTQSHPRVNSGIDEYLFYQDIQARRLWFNTTVESREDSENYDTTTLLATDIVHHIIQYNRDDEGIPPAERDPIKLYLNSPGGDCYEGFALIDAILISETPVWTYNVGTCASAAFLIYIAGHRRFTLPRAMFLLHDGQNSGWSSSHKFIDTAEFYKRYEKEVIKPYVLSRTNITNKTYDSHARVEWYMLPKDAIELGVANEIADSMHLIL